jgi:hypothetical protein
VVVEQSQSYVEDPKMAMATSRAKKSKYVFHLLFFAYSSANSKFVMGFALPTNLITYLTNAESFA